MTFLEATEANLPEIIQLLQANDLPTQDIEWGKQQFWTAWDNQTIIGVVGLEQFGQHGLLRSLAVEIHWRQQSIAKQLINELNQYCITHQIKELYLLTRTAQLFFEHLQWHVIDRESVPALIKKSAEFSSLCPTTAICMTKHLI